MRASVTLAIAGKVTTYRWTPATHTLTWKPPAGLAPGTYPVQVSAVSYAGHRTTVTLAPVVVQLGHDAAGRSRRRRRSPARR